MYEVDQYTVSLLHFENGLTDETGRVWVSNGGAAVSTYQPKFGGGSLSLDGASQYLSTAAAPEFNFATGDFTIECWVNFVSFPQDYPAILASDPGNVQKLFAIYRSSNTAGVYDIATLIASKTAVFDDNKYHHIALVKYNSKIAISVDGIFGAWVADTSTWDFGVNTRIGNSSHSPGNTWLSGYMDEFRISNIARWTDNFNPNIQAPNLTATAGDAKVTLSWDTVTDAIGYNVKRSTTTGGPYTTVGSNVSGTSYIDTTVTNGTTYYYVVTAVTADGESGNSNEASATPVAGSVTPPVTAGNAILRVTMLDSSEREYRLSTTEIDGFVNWYTRTIGTGISCYALNDIVDNSKEYLAFDKIISFKVIPLAK